VNTKKILGSGVHFFEVLSWFWFQIAMSGSYVWLWSWGAKTPARRRRRDEGSAAQNAFARPRDAQNCVFCVQLLKSKTRKNFRDFGSISAEIIQWFSLAFKSELYWWFWIQNSGKKTEFQIQLIKSISGVTPAGLCRAPEKRTRFSKPRRPCQFLEI